MYIRRAMEACDAINAQAHPAVQESDTSVWLARPVAVERQIDARLRCYRRPNLENPDVCRRGRNDAPVRWYRFRPGLASRLRSSRLWRCVGRAAGDFRRPELVSSKRHAHQDHPAGRSRINPSGCQFAPRQQSQRLAGAHANSAGLIPCCLSRPPEWPNPPSGPAPRQRQWTPLAVSAIADQQTRPTG